MKVLRQTIKSMSVILITFALIINSEIKVFSNSNNQVPINVGVILFSLDNSIMRQLKDAFENLQEENQIKVSVFDAQNNVSMQHEILDSLLHKSKTDLIIALPVDTNEASVRDFLASVEPHNIPLIMYNYFEFIHSIYINTYVDKQVNKTIIYMLQFVLCIISLVIFSI